MYIYKERRDNSLAGFTGIAKHLPSQQGSSRLYIMYIEHERQLILL